MESKHPEAVEAKVSIRNKSEDEEEEEEKESLELQDLSKPKVWSENEKPKRPSLLERMRSSRSKSKVLNYVTHRRAIFKKST